MSKLASLINLIRAAVTRIKEDYINIFSAQAAFYLIISAFPFAMFFLNLLQYVMEYLLTQEISVTAALLWDADEWLIRMYYGKVLVKG